MKLLLTGATGVAGLSVYRAALNDPLVSQVTLLLRREMPSWIELPPNAEEKTQVVIHKDFTRYSPELIARIADHDACVWALGKASGGLSEEEYTLLSYEYPMEAMKALVNGGAVFGSEDAPFQFVYISGEGADEESRMMWARVKGRTERDLIEGSTSTVKGRVIRPGYFFPTLPADRQNQRSLTARALDVVASRLLRLAPKLLTPVDTLGEFALEVAKGKWSDENLFSNARLRELMQKSS